MYLRLNYLVFNYLRLLYAQFLTSLSTAVFIFFSTWVVNYKPVDYITRYKINTEIAICM